MRTRIKFLSSFWKRPFLWKCIAIKEIINAINPPIGRGKKHIKNPIIKYLSWLVIKDLVEKDSSEIVIDEYIGQSIPICLYELAHSAHDDTDQILQSYLIMFVLFRIFDIIKPFPVSYYDKNFKNSFGVIMDDVCAGLYVVAVFVLYMVFTTWKSFLKKLSEY